MTDPTPQITPPPELVRQWHDEWRDGAFIGLENYIATQAARWGATSTTGANTMTDLERDAARYRWIRAAPRLRIERMPDSHSWISGKTGERYSVTHSLSAFDTGFSGLPGLDDLVDQAMKMYPIPSNDD